MKPLVFDESLGHGAKGLAPSTAGEISMSKPWKDAIPCVRTAPEDHRISRSPPDVVENTLILPILWASHQSPAYRIQPYIRTVLFIMRKVTNLSIPAVPLPNALLKAQKFPHFAFPILDPQLYRMRWPLSRDRE